MPPLLALIVKLSVGDGLPLVMPFVSVTDTVNVDVPVPLGVPWIVQPLKDNPVGMDPLATEQVNGAVPPVVTTVLL